MQYALQSFIDNYGTHYVQTVFWGGLGEPLGCAAGCVQAGLVLAERCIAVAVRASRAVWGLAAPGKPGHRTGQPREPPLNPCRRNRLACQRTMRMSRGWPASLPCICCLWSWPSGTLRRRSLKPAAALPRSRARRCRPAAFRARCAAASVTSQMTASQYSSFQQTDVSVSVAAQVAMVQVGGVRLTWHAPVPVA